MATYEYVNTSAKVYNAPDDYGYNVGVIYRGATIEGDITGEWLHISSIVGDDSQRYHRGILDNMYCRATYAGRSFITEKTTNTNAETGDGEADTINADEAFTYVYSNLSSEEQYRSNLIDGLDISNLRGIMGKPFQFLPNTDPRLDLSDDVKSFGRVYAEKIIKPMPLLFMTPGTPSFMASFSAKQKSTILENIINHSSDSKMKIGNFDDLIKSGSGKYYSLKFDYINYFKYVNAMLRSAAFYLGIEDETLEIDDEVTGKTRYGKKLKDFNWFFTDGGISGNDIFDNNGLSKFLGTYAGAIPFYIEAETRTSDDFSNSTTQSQLSSSIDGLSDTARELNYLIGTGASELGAGQLYDDLMSVGANSIEKVDETISSMLGKGNILSSIMSKVQTVLSGGRMVFPEIWSDSSFSRSYRITIKLSSPSGDPLCVFYNILVPIYHLIAFVLPRNSSGESYYSPFLVRAYYKGIFNVDMGIITDMSISKGSDGEWTPDGLPTTAEISFEIKDLYNSLSMSTQEVEDDKGILSNIAELDYIANSCGININEPEIGRTIKMAITLGFTSKIKDKVTMNIFGNIGQYFNQKVQNIFGTF